MATYNPNPEANFSEAQPQADAPPQNNAANHQQQPNGVQQTNDGQAASQGGSVSVGSEQVVSTISNMFTILRFSSWILSLITWSLVSFAGHGGIVYWFVTFLIGWLYHLFFLFYIFIRLCLPSLRVPPTLVFFADLGILAFTLSGWIVGIISMIANTWGTWSRLVVAAIFSCIYFCFHGYLVLCLYKESKK